MSKTKIDSVYTKVLAVQAQQSKTYSEVVALKQNHLQKFLPSYITGASLITSFLLGYWASRWALKNAKEVEQQKIDAKIISDKNDTQKRLYSEIMTSLYDYLNTSLQADYHRLHFDYYKSLSGVYQVLNENDNAIEHKNRMNVEVDKMLQYQTLMNDKFTKLNSAVFEYEYMKPDSQVSNVVSRFSQYINGFIPEKNFEADMLNSINSQFVLVTNFIATRNRKLNDTKRNHTRLKTHIYKIKSIIQEETK